MNEVKNLIEGVLALQSPTAPVGRIDMQKDLDSMKKINAFVEYIYIHHPALFEKAYKEASKWDSFLTTTAKQLSGNGKIKTNNFTEHTSLKNLNWLLKGWTGPKGKLLKIIYGRTYKMKLEKSKKERTSKPKKIVRRKKQVNLEQAIKETEKKIEQQIAEREKEIVRVKEPMTFSQNVLAIVVLGTIVLIAWLNG